MEHYYFSAGSGIDPPGYFSRGRVPEERESLYTTAADTSNNDMADADNRCGNRAGYTNSGAISAGTNPDLFSLSGNCIGGSVIFYPAFGTENSV